jgi:hypothetical protein
MKQSLSGLSAFFKTTEDYVTGGTYTAGTAYLEIILVGTFNVTGFSTQGTTDTVITGGTWLEQLCLEIILVVRLT